MPDTSVSDLTGGVRLRRAPALSRRLLRGDAGSLGAAFGLVLPTRPCTAIDGKVSALWLGPDEWLLLGAEDHAWPDWSGDSGAAFDISQRQLGILVDGDLAPDTLAGAAPLDLSPTAFAPGACTRTVFGKAEIVLWRRALDRFQVEVARSYLDYVDGLLQRCADDAQPLPPDPSSSLAIGA